MSIERVARKPSLFSVPEGDSTQTRLFGGRCSSGHVFFPPQKMGCDVCGAHGDAIEIIEIDARGVLRTFATSHRQQRPGSDTQMIVGTVVLDAGPAVEVLLDVDDDIGLEAGQRVVGHLVEIEENEAGQHVLDCFFSPEPPTEGGS